MPKTHGIIERMNYDLRETTNKLAEELKVPWTEALPQAVAAMNRRLHTYTLEDPDTGETYEHLASPLQMAYGWSKVSDENRFLDRDLPDPQEREAILVIHAM